MEIEKELISARAAAKILGVGPQKVRERIRQGIWTFGECVPKEKTGKKEDGFDVSVRKLYEFIGKGGEEN